MLPIGESSDAAMDHCSTVAAELFPAVYTELRRLACWHMDQERIDHTLTPTALLHETWLRLGDRPLIADSNSRSYFFAAAAETMRRILVEHARRHRRRSVILQTSVYHEFQSSRLSSEIPPDLMILDNALSRLKKCHPEKAELVQLRFFGGLTLPEVANVLEISLATANRHWAFARAWLSRELNDRAHQD